MQSAPEGLQAAASSSLNTGAGGGPPSASGRPDAAPMPPSQSPRQPQPLSSSANAPPGPSAPSSAASPVVLRVLRRPKRAVERSCIVCHRRKVRCDKGLPCANCTRAGVLCCYPSSEKAPRQPKTTIADIASRLVQLERTIVAVSGGDAGGPGGTGGEGASGVSANSTLNAPAHDRRAAGRATSSLAAVMSSASSDSRNSPSPGTTPQADDASSCLVDDELSGEGGGPAAEEILLKNSYASRYINEILLSRVLEEEQEIQSVLASPKVSDDVDETPDGSGWSATIAGPPSVTLFGTLTGSRFLHLQQLSPTDNLHPPKALAIQLWQAYVQNVEPLNKLLHIPTAEVEMFTAINNPAKANPALESLLFAIYYATSTTYQPEEYRAIFGEDKALALDRYSAGMERALVQANFLESPSLPTLQALALFFRTARAHNPGRSTWILFGMAIRAAQSIGLHRDGTNFDMTPFEAEMRRRVWWHMVAQDARAAEDHGITVGAYEPSSDIRVPLNVNDSELYPEMAELPTPQIRWTEMTLVVSLYRLGQTMLLVSKMLATASPPLTESRRREILAERNAYVESLLRQCNPVVPIQRTTLKQVRMMQLKFDFVSRLSLMTITMSSPGAGAEGDQRAEHRAAHATEDNLRAACDIIELHLDIMTDEMMQNFQWNVEGFTQYHVLLFVVWYLCVKPPSPGPLLDRAWAAVDGLFWKEGKRERRQDMRAETSGRGGCSSGGSQASTPPAARLKSNPKWAVVTALREKALRIREAREKAKQQFPPVDSADHNTGPEGYSMPIDSNAYGSPPADAAPAFGSFHGEAQTGVPQGMAGHMLPEITVGAVPGQQQQVVNDADMMAFLGDDNSLDMGMDMDWNEDFLDWNTVSNDFRSKTNEYYLQ